MTSITDEPRTSVAIDVPLYALTRSLPASRFLPGRARERVTWGVCGSLLVALIAGLVVGPPRRPGCFGPRSKGDIARMTMIKYTREAYPEFLLANPTRTCPVALQELNLWMNRKDTRDPWGTNYTMTCGPSTILVGSAGEDARFGTADDLWSNE